MIDHQQHRSQPFHASLADTDPDDVVPAPYPPTGDDVIIPGLPSDPIPNPEPETPSLGTPDPGIYEGTRNRA